MTSRSAGADVIVVGAGVVGAVTALLLQRAGAAVTLVERRPPEARSPTAGRLGPDLRTLALAPTSLALLQRLGAWSEACVRGACPYRAMEVWDGEGTGRIRFDAAEVGAETLGSIIPNHVLVRALWEALVSAGVDRVAGLSVTTLERGGYTGDTVLVLDGGTRLAAPLVVAADGGDSRVRTLAGIECSEEDMGQRAIATLAEVVTPHEHTAWQRFLPSGPLAFLPLPDDGEGRHLVSVVWSMDAPQSVALEELSEDAFTAELTGAFERRFGGIRQVDRRVAFPLRQRHARSYRAPGVVLVGDAAHVVHPMAGQGVNIGLRDAEVLVDELRPHLSRGIEARRLLGDPDLLYHYERSRRRENAIMLGALGGLHRLFSADDLAVRLLRNAGLGIVNRLAPVKRELMVQALGFAQAAT